MDLLGTKGCFVPFHSQTIKAMVETKPSVREEITTGAFHDR
jgi:hypothetical protein